MQNILFICVHNANRSQMAEAFFNARATEQGIEARAESAGTKGAGALGSLAIRAMDEVGVSMTGQIPKQLKSEMVDRASRIVSMGRGVTGEGCIAKFTPSDDWALDDPSGQTFGEVRRIRDEIRAKVDEMVADLE
jgi:arsenate reductase